VTGVPVHAWAAGANARPAPQMTSNVSNRRM
jgi:hypothetical protein